MHIAVVDDTRADADALISYIQQFSQQTGISLTAHRYPSAALFMDEELTQFSMVVLDIDMPGMNGVECARKLREKDPGIVIMFVTNMPQYALVGYEVEAVDYVLKPITYADFSLKLHKALRYVEQNRDKEIILQVGPDLLRIPVWEILYVESAQHYVIYHFADHEIRLRGSMAEAERKLGQMQFAKCNSCYLVNLRRVSVIRRDDVELGRVSLRISRGCRAEFLNRFAAYAGGLE